MHLTCFFIAMHCVTSHLRCVVCIVLYCVVLYQVLEEFETDDGIPYWFDRRTGETFWERPLCAEEKVLYVYDMEYCRSIVDR